MESAHRGSVGARPADDLLPDEAVELGAEPLEDLLVVFGLARADDEADLHLALPVARHAAED